MSLISFIKNLQNKPRYFRIQILWFSVFLSMIIIVSLWFFSLKYSIRNFSNQETDEFEELSETIKQVNQEMPSLKQALKASIGSLFEKKVDFNKNKTEDSIDNSLKEIKPAKLPLAN